jgi:hypothetical protein
VVLSVVVRSGLFMTAVNGTLVARPVSTTTTQALACWHRFGRWARPVQGNPSLVGKRSAGGRGSHGQQTILDK